jgi:hypothetical protein
MRALPDVRPGNEFKGAFAKYSLGVFAKGAVVRPEAFIPPQGLGRIALAVCTESEFGFARTVREVLQSQKKYWHRPNVSAMLKCGLRNYPELFPTKQRK